jgi:hypothetical protein
MTSKKQLEWTPRPTTGCSSFWEWLEL